MMVWLAMSHNHMSNLEILEYHDSMFEDSKTKFQILEDQKFIQSSSAKKIFDDVIIT